MLLIRSTYEEYAPDFDRYPSGRVWAVQAPDYAAGWEAVKAYLTEQQGWRELTHSQTGRVGLAPKGHAEPFAFFGDTLILNDAETIAIGS
jgi:hypothetical protein